MYATISYVEDFSTWDVWVDQDQIGSYETQEEAEDHARKFNDAELKKRVDQSYQEDDARGQAHDRALREGRA